MVLGLRLLGIETENDPANHSAWVEDICYPARLVNSNNFASGLGGGIRSTGCRSTCFYLN